MTAFACVSCRDGIEPWRCDLCRKDVKDRCAECHGEKSHGRLGPPPRPWAPKHPQQPGKFHEDEDMNRRSDQ